MRAVERSRDRVRTSLPVCLLLAVLLAAGATACSRERRAAQAPNLVLVVVDALRRDRVGAYGYELPTTPFLDSLERSGVVFDYACERRLADAKHADVRLEGRLGEEGVGRRRRVQLRALGYAD